MTMFRSFLPVTAIVALASPAAFAPANAAVDTREPGRFIDSLADTAFGALRTGNKAAARAQFRSILSQHFAVSDIGDRLIKRWRPRISAAQYAQYKAAFPGFIINTYGDRLAPYADADLRVLRVVPQGTNAAVMTTVTRPGSRASSAVWTVSRIGGAYKVTNLTVANVNLAVVQQADFDSQVQRQGFDGLLAFIKSRS